MIPEQRRALILDALRRDEALSFSELAELVGVSHMTIRRDAATLEQLGLLRIVRGGASLPARLRFEPAREAKVVTEVAKKTAIASAASALVRDAMTIYLDAGTTAQAMRPFLEQVCYLTIVTNDLATLQAFMDHPQADLILVGGRVDRANASTTGRLASATLAHLAIDTAFVSSSSWDLEHGITTPSEAKVEVKRAAVASARQSVLIADSSKYGQLARHRALRLTEVSQVITDSSLPKRTADAIRLEGVDLAVV